MLQLKPIRHQVIVITGATSGIGLATAKLAAERGAKLVLVARNETALKTIAEELSGKGAQARWVVADVADEAELRRAAQVAKEEFGGLDTWINNAGISIFGYNERIALEDHRRLFETNFWGVVNGSLIAAEYLRQSGGAIINLGSEVSDASVPLQGMYAASKHAVKAFTDSLRMELEHDGAPVSVTLIKPAAIATPFVEHAKNYMEVEAKLPPPLYAPELVAKAILSAAQTPQRDIFVGGAAKLTSLGARFAPRLFDKISERIFFRQQRSDRPEQHADRNSLYQPDTDLRVRGNHDASVKESCLYTQAILNKKKTYAIVGGALAATAAVWLSRSQMKRSLL
ncbi:MAG TPA: SDR family oxidoreductase [Spongiibacteraceae bacterium]